MVIHIGALKSGNWDYVRRDIGAVVAAAGDDVIVKVILETCLLTDEEIQEACLVSRDAGADYVKTSTGFSTGGATVEAVSLMKRTVGSDMKVKASGGIHTLEDARKMFYAGADRIGSSSGVAIAEAEMSEIHTI
jgi:deoxyribose-phosphate aldolase